MDSFTPFISFPFFKCPEGHPNASCALMFSGKWKQIRGLWGMMGDFSEA